MFKQFKKHITYTVIFCFSFSLLQGYAYASPKKDTDLEYSQFKFKLMHVLGSTDFDSQAKTYLVELSQYIKSSVDQKHDTNFNYLLTVQRYLMDYFYWSYQVEFRQNPEAQGLLLYYTKGIFDKLVTYTKSDSIVGNSVSDQDIRSMDWSTYEAISKNTQQIIKKEYKKPSSSRLKSFYEQSFFQAQGDNLKNYVFNEIVYNPKTSDVSASEVAKKFCSYVTTQYSDESPKNLEPGPPPPRKSPYYKAYLQSHSELVGEAGKKCISQMTSFAQEQLSFITTKGFKNRTAAEIFKDFNSAGAEINELRITLLHQLPNKEILQNVYPTKEPWYATQHQSSSNIVNRGDADAALESYLEKDGYGKKILKEYWDGVDVVVSKYPSLKFILADKVLTKEYFSQPRYSDDTILNYDNYHRDQLPYEQRNPLDAFGSMQPELELIGEVKDVSFSKLFYDVQRTILEYSTETSSDYIALMNDMWQGRDAEASAINGYIIESIAKFIKTNPAAIQRVFSKQPDLDHYIDFIYVIDQKLTKIKKHEANMAKLKTVLGYTAIVAGVAMIGTQIFSWAGAGCLELGTATLLVIKGVNVSAWLLLGAYGVYKITEDFNKVQDNNKEVDQMKMTEKLWAETLSKIDKENPKLLTEMKWAGVFMVLNFFAISEIARFSSAIRDGGIVLEEYARFGTTLSRSLQLDSRLMRAFVQLEKTFPKEYLDRLIVFLHNCDLSDTEIISLIKDGTLLQNSFLDRIVNLGYLNKYNQTNIKNFRWTFNQEYPGLFIESIKSVKSSSKLLGAINNAKKLFSGKEINRFTVYLKKVGVKDEDIIDLLSNKHLDQDPLFLSVKGSRILQDFSKKSLRDFKKIYDENYPAMIRPELFSNPEKTLETMPDNYRLHYVLDTYGRNIPAYIVDNESDYTFVHDAIAAAIQNNDYTDITLVNDFFKDLESYGIESHSVSFNELMNYIEKLYDSGKATSSNATPNSNILGRVQDILQGTKEETFGLLKSLEKPTSYVVGVVERTDMPNELNILYFNKISYQLSEYGNAYLKTQQSLEPYEFKAIANKTLENELKIKKLVEDEFKDSKALMIKARYAEGDKEKIKILSEAKIDEQKINELSLVYSIDFGFSDPYMNKLYLDYTSTLSLVGKSKISKNIDIMDHHTFIKQAHSFEMCEQKLLLRLKFLVDGKVDDNKELFMQAFYEKNPYLLQQQGILSAEEVNKLIDNNVIENVVVSVAKDTEAAGSNVVTQIKVNTNYMLQGGKAVDLSRPEEQVNLTKFNEWMNIRSKMSKDEFESFLRNCKHATGFTSEKFSAYVSQIEDKGIKLYHERLPGEANVHYRVMYLYNYNTNEINVCGVFKIEACGASVKSGATHDYITFFKANTQTLVEVAKKLSLPRAN